MNKTTKFNTLYKRSSTGKLLEWTIQVDGNTITTRWGESGGKMQETVDVILEGKNIGKANETTPENQAIVEAWAQHDKKLKKDYCETAEAALKGESSELIAGGILPMLAHKYSEHGDKIKWPALLQPKLDGHRCIAIMDSKGQCTLWSRTRKPILSMPHIVKAIEQYAKPNTVWDGECYAHDYRDKFEKLSSLIRPNKPKAGHEIVQYHIYDAVNGSAATQRIFDVADMAFNHPPLVAVETIQVQDEDEMMVAFEKFLAQGYEGAIVRNINGLYANKRSYDLQKVKQFDDAEFEITGVQEGRGKLAGHGIFECKTNKGNVFAAKMKGDTARLKQYYEHPQRYIGRLLTVQYQGYTEYGVPRFPVAIRLQVD